jgi:hypothetical protein
MSSDRTGSVGKAAEAVTGAAAADTGSARSAAVDDPAAVDDSAAIDDAQAADPWFAAGPKVGMAAEAGESADSGESAGGSDRTGSGRAADGGPTGNGASPDGSGETQAEWFLPAGRAGLLPDSMTVIWDDDGTSTRDGGHDFRVEAAGAPPWAAEAADPAAAPPPWETGPWPGPGGGIAGSGVRRRHGDDDSVARTESVAGADSGGAADREMGADSAGSTADDVPGGAATTNAAWRSGAAAGPGGSRWSARTVLVAGLVPLVIPGLVVGILGLRRPGSQSVRTASWVAIGASLVWAVIIVLIVAGGAGGSAGACAGYPPAVHRAYDKAMTDLRDRAPASVLTADLGSAASLANVSAAAAGQIGVRTALFTMASDMAQARADVVAGRPVPAALRTHLSDDATAPSGSCTS